MVVKAEKVGIVSENGTMTEDFEVGEYDPTVVENWGNGTGSENEESEARELRIRVKKFSLCPDSMREYIRCMDNEEAIRQLKSTERGERFERHYPEKGKELNCLVAAPKNYKVPIPWPRGRDEVLFDTLMFLIHILLKIKDVKIGLQETRINLSFLEVVHNLCIVQMDTWMRFLRRFTSMIPGIAFGRHTRVTLDVGCGVASFGAYLMSLNVITLSIASKDVHGNQIQFALEQAVPAMVVVFAAHCLPYPSQAFDMIHCSRCRINWTHDDGILLLEVNRMLRTGGYFSWAAQSVYNHEAILEEQWNGTKSQNSWLCTFLFIYDFSFVVCTALGMLTSSYVSRFFLRMVRGYVWAWPERLRTPPERLQTIQIDAYVSRKELFSAGSKYWNEIVGGFLRAWHWKKMRVRNVMDLPENGTGTIQIDAYVSRKELFSAGSKYWNEIVGGFLRAWHWKKMRVRNVMDMRASYGGFAAALIDNGIIDCWVLNVVPVSGPNTLLVIYDRGLIGVMQYYEYND
ncbi:LOW QUALITY PROTEIN: hypothetical protein Cgig2_028015 [Carnegiea gigantea]|uniref:Methyltransferase n=1 Tax=Carnegiea gigantea TaxID=171969 RepID=A0A9Q1JPV7_9CARY|nr:LOW QUALITY PROTEIN: hypothetical protein Cgig2_028015 [Carnegiea gigantea]